MNAEPSRGADRLAGQLDQSVGQIREARNQGEEEGQIDQAGCARLLAAVRFGRLAVVVDEGLPMVVVLNHVCDGADVMFCTGAGSRLAALTVDAAQVPAVFEVDSAFPRGRGGWSVIAHGLLSREDDASRATRTRSRVAVWAGGERDLVLRLAVRELTGRRVGPADHPADHPADDWEDDPLDRLPD